MALVHAALDDLAQLLDRVPQVILAVVEMRPEPDARAWTEVADDAALAELPMHGRVVRSSNKDGAASALGVAWTADLEARLVQQIDQQLRQRKRPFADPVDADLFDHVVAGGRRVERGHVRRARQEASRAG